MEQKLIDKFIDHAESELFKGDIFKMLEDKHDSILEWIDSMNIFLILCLNLLERA